MNPAEERPDIAARLKKEAMAFKSELAEEVESKGKYKHQRE